MNYLFRMPVPVFNYPHSKEMFPNAQPSLAQFCIIPILTSVPGAELSISSCFHSSESCIEQ